MANKFIDRLIAAKEAQIKSLQARITNVEFKEMEFIEKIAYDYDTAKVPITHESNTDVCAALRELHDFILTLKKLLVKAEAERDALMTKRG